MNLINEKSTTKEILSEIRYTFMVQEFEEYQAIVVRREEDLKAALNKLKEDYNLLERNHCSSELEKLELEEKLKKIKNEFDSLKKKKKHCLSESEVQFSDHQKTKKPKIEKTDVEAVVVMELRRQNNKLKEEMEVMELRIENDKLKGEMEVMDLRRVNDKLKEEIDLYHKKFPEHVNRMDCIEEMLEDLREKYASNIRGQNVDDDHLQNQGGDTPINGLNVPNSSSDDLQRRINVPSTEAIFIEPAANDVEVSLSTAPLNRAELNRAELNRAEPLIIVVDGDSSDIDSDDLSITGSFMDEIARKKR